MKRFLRMAASAAFLLLLSACARHKIIPDDTLAQIFHDAFLTNAYIGSEGVKTDSLRIYEPIFARYGYTTDDVHYTIGNFSKRKSARLGDVVERAIEMLEREGKIYNQEVAVLDTIDNVARRTFTVEVSTAAMMRSISAVVSTSGSWRPNLGVRTNSAGDDSILSEIIRKLKKLLMPLNARACEVFSRPRS